MENARMGNGITSPQIPTLRASDIPGETVPVSFPKPVLLTLDFNRQIFFPAGKNDVPKSIADHWYLKANGAEKLR